MLGEAAPMIAALLPGSWTVDFGWDEGRDSGDGVLVVRGPAGVEAPFRVESQRRGALPVRHLLTMLEEAQRASGLPVLFVSDYIGPTVRRALTDAGVSYADATGWARLTSEDPLILLTGEGAERSPRAPDTAAVVRMNGVATGRLVRALSVTKVPVGVRELASTAGVSPGSASKLLTTLAAEGIVDRNDRGAVVGVRRRALLRRWVQDYGYPTANPAVGYWLAPRGLTQVTGRLAEQQGVTITGSAAARRLLPPDRTSVVPLRLLALYTASPRQLADQLGLVETDPPTANVVIAVPQDQRLLPPPGEPPALAPAALVVADLLTLPGRSDAEAEQLLDVLAASDPAWEE